MKSWEFQSTLPLRGATRRNPQNHQNRMDFNPHSPCGERQRKVLMAEHAKEFQSTLPLRGATRSEHHHSMIVGISIHTPLAGSDRRNETFLTK